MPSLHPGCRPGRAEHREDVAADASGAGVALNVLANGVSKLPIIHSVLRGASIHTLGKASIPASSHSQRPCRAGAGGGIIGSPVWTRTVPVVEPPKPSAKLERTHTFPSWARRRIRSCTSSKYSRLERLPAKRRYSSLPWKSSSRRCGRRRSRDTAKFAPLPDDHTIFRQRLGAALLFAERRDVVGALPLS